MELMQRRRELMAMQSELPSAYRKVEYLQSSGTQYFWTDVNVQDGLTVESVQTIASGNDSYLFGGAANADNERSNFNGFYVLRLQGAYPVSYYNGGPNLAYNTVYRIKTTHTDGTITAYVNDALYYTGTRTGTTPETGAKCVCFGARAMTGAALTGHLYKGKVYSVKVSKGNELLANYIPCVRKSDSKPGMYDTVSKTFYTNAGTGEFSIPT